MASSSSAMFNGTLVLATTSSPTTSETITNIVFGLCALTVSGVTIWQGRNIWKMWMRIHASRASAEGMPMTEYLGTKNSRKNTLPGGIALREAILTTMIVGLPDLSHELDVLHLESNMPTADSLHAAGPVASNELSSATARLDGNTASLEHVSVSGMINQTLHSTDATI